MCACAEGHQHRHPFPLFIGTRKWTKRQEGVFFHWARDGPMMIRASEADCLEAIKNGVPMCGGVVEHAMEDGVDMQERVETKNGDEKTEALLVSTGGMADIPMKRNWLVQAVRERREGQVPMFTLGGVSWKPAPPLANYFEPRPADEFEVYRLLVHGQACTWNGQQEVMHQYRRTKVSEEVFLTEDVTALKATQNFEQLEAALGSLRAARFDRWGKQSGQV